MKVTYDGHDEKSTGFAAVFSRELKNSIGDLFTKARTSVGHLAGALPRGVKRLELLIYPQQHQRAAFNFHIVFVRTDNRALIRRGRS